MQRITVGARIKNLQLRNGRWEYFKLESESFWPIQLVKERRLGLVNFE